MSCQEDEEETRRKLDLQKNILQGSKPVKSLPLGFSDGSQKYNLHSKFYQKQQSELWVKQKQQHPVKLEQQVKSLPLAKEGGMAEKKGDLAKIALSEELSLNISGKAKPG